MTQSNFDVPLSESGKILDFLTGDQLEPGPEEFVRQRYLRSLHFEYGYPKGHLRREVPIFHGGNEIRDTSGKPVRADIVVYQNAQAAAERNQGQAFLVIECKAPNVDAGYNQLVSYLFNTSAEGGVWFNGSGDDDEVEYFRRELHPVQSLVPYIGIPRYGEAWDALGRRRKAELIKPRDIKGLLRRCHNRLHGRGAGGEEEDLTMDMVRIILAKAQDEERPGELPEFYCTADEYVSDSGRRVAAGRIAALFDQVKELNGSVFTPHESITVSPRAVCDVVIELQSYQIVADIHDAQDWDIMGAAYEQYTSASLRRERGQFFTNRLVVNFLIAALAPAYNDKILDPAGGSGGFLTSAMRFVRSQILDSNDTPIAKKRRLDRFKHYMFMVEQSKRLVKVAKTAMILNGDGHAGMTAGDSLGDYTQFDETILAQCSRGVPSVIFTNPPFAGVGDGRITDREVLGRFQCGKRWDMVGGHFVATADLATGGVPPELLFFERCIDWLAPNGRLAIVLPKSFLDTTTYRSGREFLFANCQLLAVINCHKDTFQPHTGVRTCLVLLRKLNADEPPVLDYPIFMAVSRKIGQDSEGLPIYTRGEEGLPTDVIDHDLDSILAAYKNFQIGQLVASQYVFQIHRADLDETLKLNPQRFLPHLNETIERLTALDGVDGWSVTALGQLSPDIKVFKGPRLQSEPLIVAEKLNATTEAYYTPGAILQEKSDSVKWVDLARGNARQLKPVAPNRVRSGDIVITRSGTIGRVAYIGAHLDNALVSDDLIRVRVPEERLRLYLFNYLQTEFAYNQLLRNEYGAVQQHLEPEHVRDVLVPTPDSWERLEEIVNSSGRLVELKEEVFQLSRDTPEALEALLSLGMQAGDQPQAAPGDQ